MRESSLGEKPMDDAGIEKLIQGIPTKDLKAEAKKRGIACGRCPKKMDIAKKLPLEALQALSRKR
jgi:hypothetical protein